MTDLDVTGARANDPGLTREARRAEAREKREARRAAFWSKAPKRLLLAVVAAIVIAASVFDWWMSSRGWADLMPGLGFIAGIGAVASVGFWYVGVDRAIEEFRQKDWLWGGIWAGVACAGWIICVLGVGLATLTNTSQARLAAESSRAALLALQVERDDLVETLDVYDVEYWNARIKADVRILKSHLSIATGTLGMADLDVDGGCAKKLSFDQRRACAYMNGGTDPHTGADVVGYLTKLEQSQAGLKGAEKSEARLAELNTQIDNFDEKTGDETARALVFFFQSETVGGQAMLVIFGVLSALFLLAGGFFSAWFFRQIREGKTI